MTQCVSASTTIELPVQFNSEELQQILTNLSGSRNQLEALQWHLKGSENTILDFTVLHDLAKKKADWHRGFGINIVWLAKILFLYNNRGKLSISIYRKVFNSICKTFLYLSENNQLIINKDSLEDYFRYQMMHTLEEGHLHDRLTPLGHKYISDGVNIRSWMLILKRFNLDGILFSTVISEAIIIRTLKNTIENISGGDLTYYDWKVGGSFNALTLEYGRFYVEHCAEYFERHITLAIALNKTILNIAFISKKAGISCNKSVLKSETTPIAGNFLMGKEVHELPSNYQNSHSFKYLKNLQKHTLEEFEKNLRFYRAHESLLSDTEIDNLAVKLGIDSPSTSQSYLLKHMTRSWLNMQNLEQTPSDPNHSTTNINLTSDLLGVKVDLNMLSTAIKSSLKHLYANVDLTLPTEKYFQAAGVNISNFKGSTYINEFKKLVEKSGVTFFVATTGWRESEYGFGLNNINIHRNLDLLDQQANPFRYEVKWVVPKQNGETKLRREITQLTYQYAYQLSLLVNATDDCPCLYSVSNPQIIYPNRSEGFIASAVSKMWIHFVDNYTPFIKLDMMDELSTLRTKNHESLLNSAETKKLMDLEERCNSENWEELSTNSLLQAARQQARYELPRVKFFLNLGARSGFIWAYHENTIDTELRALLDSFLSSETKESINNLTDKNQVGRGFTNEVVNEIMADALYPTPHAFRHMWAEAVYRRFDGDAGWMIRSTFKYITQNMWLDYIRNKDNRRQHDIVKRRVISSLLHNYIHKAGKGYSGVMDKLLRRLFLKTKVTKLKDIYVVVEEFAQTEIVSIKANPWGYCLLRRRNQFRAKCAENGIPQRHNAWTTLCLGCSNNLSQDGNIEGILLAISNDLKVLHTAAVPEAFRRESYKSVSIALKHLTVLGTEPEVLADLQEALNVCPSVATS